jgi:hypothetical protein
MRNKTVRGKTLRKKVVTGKAATTDSEKLLIIRALFIVVYNREESLLPFAVEFFHLLSEILEGTHAEDLQLTLLDRETLLRTMRELTQKD